MVTGIYRQHRNAQCIHCGHIGFSSRFPDERARHPSICTHCKNAGKAFEGTDPEPEGAPAAPEAITWCGQTVNAPGFTQDQFDRAMVRAFIDSLQVKREGNRYLVGHSDSYAYAVTRERCTCKAGEMGTPCKHRALLIAHLDIRMPATAKQWSKLMADRPAGKAVA